MRTAPGIVRVWEVLADIDGEGPAGDGTAVRRFRTQRDADAFAATATCYGKPATVDYHDAPRKLAQRWGMA